mgnify:FL=1
MKYFVGVVIFYIPTTVMAHHESISQNSFLIFLLIFLLYFSFKLGVKK